MNFPHQNAAPAGSAVPEEASTEEADSGWRMGRSCASMRSAPFAHPCAASEARTCFHPPRVIRSAMETSKTRPPLPGGELRFQEPPLVGRVLTRLADVGLKPDLQCDLEDLRSQWCSSWVERGQLAAGNWPEWRAAVIASGSCAARWEKLA
jgi:hypothetical protein